MSGTLKEQGCQRNWNQKNEPADILMYLSPVEHINNPNRIPRRHGADSASRHFWSFLFARRNQDFLLEKPSNSKCDVHSFKGAK
jgi:hypothetical protein